MIYSDVLTIDEIVSLFNNDNSLNDNIVGFWNCNTGTGDILYDQSGNMNNGSISIYGKPINENLNIPYNRSLYFIKQAYHIIYKFPK